MDLKIRKINLSDKDNLEGLSFLKEITVNENELYSSPVPKEINEYLYLGFLKLSEDEANENINYRYWILNTDKIIGYSDIKVSNNNGDIGIILSPLERGKSIGFNAMKLLINEAKKNLKLETVTIPTSNKNIPMKKVC